MRYQLGEHVEDRGQGVAVGPAGRDRDVRPSTQDLTDQSGARGPRADFEKEANAVVIGAFDQCGEVDGLDGLGRDRVGRRSAVESVRSVPRLRCRNRFRVSAVVSRSWRHGIPSRRSGRSRSAPC